MKFKYDDLFKRIDKVKAIITEISEEELEDMFPTYKSIKLLREMGVKETEIKTTIDALADEAIPQNKCRSNLGLSIQQVHMNKAIDALGTLNAEFDKNRDANLVIRNALIDLLNMLDQLYDTDEYDEALDGLMSVCLGEGLYLYPYEGE